MTKVHMKPVDGGAIIVASLTFAEWQDMFRRAEWKGVPLLWIQVPESTGELGGRIYFQTQRR